MHQEHTDTAYSVCCWYTEMKSYIATETARFVYSKKALAAIYVINSTSAAAAAAAAAVCC
jgi:hypothetical protein